MITTTDTTFNLSILERNLALVFSLLLSRASFPVCYRSEDDILCDASGIRLRSRWLALLSTKLRPLFTLGYAWVDRMRDDCFPDTSTDFDLLSIVANVECYECLRSVFVFDYVRCLSNDIVVIFICPVGPPSKSEIRLE